MRTKKGTSMCLWVRRGDVLMKIVVAIDNLSALKNRSSGANFVRLCNGSFDFSSVQLVSSSEITPKNMCSLHSTNIEKSTPFTVGSTI